MSSLGFRSRPRVPQQTYRAAAALSARATAGLAAGQARERSRRRTATDFLPPDRGAPVPGQLDAKRDRACGLRDWLTSAVCSQAAPPHRAPTAALRIQALWRAQPLPLVRKQPIAGQQHRTEIRTATRPPPSPRCRMCPRGSRALPNRHRPGIRARD